MSQKILKEHGGDIRVESTAGEGSRFTLDLPAIKASDKSEASAATGSIENEVSTEDVTTP